MYNEIIDKYYKEIFAYCKTQLYGDIAGAEDCTQETFLALHKKLHRLKMSADIKYWLYKTAAFEIKNYQRKNTYRQHLNIDDVEDNKIVSDDNIENDYELKEKVSSLSEDEKQLITEYYTGQHPEKRLNKSINSISVQVHRIMKKLNL